MITKAASWFWRRLTAPIPLLTMIIASVLTTAWLFVGQPLGVVCSLAGLVLLLSRPR